MLVTFHVPHYIHPIRYSHREATLLQPRARPLLLPPDVSAVNVVVSITMVRDPILPFCSY